MAIDSEKDWRLWRQYQSAWNRAERLQSLWEGDSVFFGVIYDNQRRRWLVNCVDTHQWITDRFRGGHRRYRPEIWRDE